MVWVRRRSGGWQANWRTSDGRIASHQRSDWTKWEAQAYAREMGEGAKRVPWATATPSEIPVFADFAEGFFAARRPAPSSVAKERKIRDRLIEEFGPFRLTEVSPLMVRGFVADLAEGLSRGYVNDHLGLLKRLFNRAVGDGYLKQSPVIDAAPPRKTRGGEKARAFPEDLVPELVETIDPRYRLFVLTLYATGARIGEVAALRVCDIDFARDRVSISRSFSSDEKGATIVTPGKTEASRRVVSLPKWLVAEIGEHVRESGTIGESPVFTSPTGALLNTRNWRRRVWGPAVTAIGAPDFTPHSLRHLHASTLLKEGRPISEISSRLGHENPEVTLRVYSHFIDPDDRAAAAVIADPRRASG